jgi:cytidine deaminase
LLDLTASRYEQRSADPIRAVEIRLIHSDTARLSVTLLDVNEGHEPEFRTLVRLYEGLLKEKGYGHSEMVRDEAMPTRFYSVRYWHDAASAERCHADADVRELTVKLYQVARVSHVVNGTRKAEQLRLLLDERRITLESDRRAGFDRRVKDVGRPEGDRRSGTDRRIGPRRLHGRPDLDLVGAARRAREHAEAAYSNFKVGAAVLAADGDVFAGCNIENATYGLTMCAERVALFKALSEGQRAFTRIVIVSDRPEPAPPCGACRQVLWEFCGNIEVVLANLAKETGTYPLKDLLPRPFDARTL